jgi:hypothetical protein
VKTFLKENPDVFGRIMEKVREALGLGANAEDAEPEEIKKAKK